LEEDLKSGMKSFDGGMTSLLIPILNAFIADASTGL
jgi:hypothetical protein